MCAIQLFLGIDCPACGLTRAVLAFLTGHFYESIALHPMGAAVVLWMSGLWRFGKRGVSFAGRKPVSLAVLFGFFGPWVVKLWMTN